MYKLSSEQHILVDQRLVLNRKYRQLGKQY